MYHSSHSFIYIKFIIQFNFRNHDCICQASRTVIFNSVAGWFGFMNILVGLHGILWSLSLPSLSLPPSLSLSLLYYYLTLLFTRMTPDNRETEADECGTASKYKHYYTLIFVKNSRIFMIKNESDWFGVIDSYDEVNKLAWGLCPDTEMFMFFFLPIFRYLVCLIRSMLHREIYCFTIGKVCCNKHSIGLND